VTNFAIGGPGSTFGFLFFAIVAIILMASWVILAASRFIQGGVVERPERVPQLYGYTVCLIALVVGLASLLSVVEAGLSLADPTSRTESPWTGWSEPSVVSFEAFRATHDRAREMRVGPGGPAPEPLTEAELRRRFEGLRADRIARVRASARRSLITSGLTLLVSLGLFAWHWRWLRRWKEPAPGVPVVARAATDA
jgi:hypothetical protein